MYKALVTRISVQPHPNADRLAIGRVADQQVIVGNGTQDGQLGVFFQADGQLSEAYAAVNDLVRRKDESGRPAGGMFEHNRRVKAIRLRGVKSDGFWTTLDTLRKVGVSAETIDNLKEGDAFSELDGIEICRKYFTPSTLRAMQQGAKVKRVIDTFPEHVDSAQYSHARTQLLPGSWVYITEKLHGTSGRYGLVEVTDNLNLWERVKRLFGVKIYKHVIGTRRTILAEGKTGYYGSEQFRRDSVKHIALRRGEIIYYELVGYTETGQPIMPAHDTSKVSKEFAAAYPTAVYSYGNGVGECGLYVYRITQDKRELTWPEVKRRCNELGLRHVPEVYPPFILSDDYLEGLDDIVKRLEVGTSTIDHALHREGIILRIESAYGDTIVKSKNNEFKIMEGILKDAPTYVDLEEIS